MIEDLDVDHAAIFGRETHVDAAGGLGGARLIPRHGDRHLADVQAVDAGADQSRDDRPLDHPRAAREVAVGGDRRAFREDGAIGGTEPGGELRHHLEVCQSGDTGAGEDRPPRLATPDHAAAHGRAGIDVLVGPELDVGPDACSLANGAVMADHRALEDDGARLEAALPAHDRAMQVRPFADVAVRADDAAVDGHVLLDDGVVTDHGGTVDNRIAPHLHAFAQEDGAVEARRWIDLGVAFFLAAGHPDAAG